MKPISRRNDEALAGCDSARLVRHGCPSWHNQRVTEDDIIRFATSLPGVVAVTASEDRVRVEIADDGVGGADPARGSGLRGLADWVETLGGTLQVDSVPGRGTRLAADIPLGGQAR